MTSPFYHSALAAVVFIGFCTTIAAGQEAETLPPLKDGKALQTFEELWSEFDPRTEPLDVEVLHQWEQDRVVLKVIRYRVGIFKGKKAMMAAVYGYPKGARRVPGLVQIHGGGGAGTEEPVLANAKEGYATISIASDGRIRASLYPIDNEAKQLFWDGKKDDPNYRLTTDWGDLEGYFFPRRYQNRNAAEHQFDPIDSPRNSSWFLWTIGVRRAITFLEQQPEVHGEKIGVYGHSMGGELTVAVAGCASRVKAASPSCGGITYKSRREEEEVLSSQYAHQRISCPILFLMASNDFNGRIHDLPPAVERLKTKDWRVVSAPHRNHSADPAHFASVTLRFDQFLKNEFRMPGNPETTLVLDTADNTPEFTVTPDNSRQILSVDIYYTQQDDSDYTDRVTAMTKYWQHAPATESESTWTAKLPLFSTDKQLWVYADIAYALDRKVFAAGVKASATPSLLIEDFQGDWAKEWFVQGANSKKTFKLRSPQYQAPPNSRLGIEVRSETKGRMLLVLEREKESYRHTIAIDGDS